MRLRENYTYETTEGRERVFDILEGIEIEIGSCGLAILRRE
jgi:hypothetical protein